jgi:HK97 family phage major capsid protein
MSEDHFVSAEEFHALKGQLAGFADRVDGLADTLASVRRPSMATRIGSRPTFQGDAPSYSDSDPGFVLAIAKARSRDAQEQAAGKAALEDLGARFAPPDPGVKATLGTTDATGGWVIPNAVVDDLVKPREFSNVYRDLLTVRTGVRGATVDIPLRSAGPARAVIAAYGATKENVDLAYNGYTATMYSLARIYDIGNQFLRQSAGAAQRDVLQELGNALGRGEAYYIREGTGSSQPYGYVPALTNGPADFRTSFTAATTLAGSVLAAIGTAAGDLMSRNRRPEAAVISANVYKTMVTQGADAAGFYVNGLTGAQSLPGFRPGTLVTPWGIPIVVDTDAASDDLVVGEWSAMKLYIGDEARVDSSDEAGTRWDTNVTGFRGEEDMAFDARPAVYAGALQMVTDVIP